MDDTQQGGIALDQLAAAAAAAAAQPAPASQPQPVPQAAAQQPQPAAAPAAPAAAAPQPAHVLQGIDAAPAPSGPVNVTYLPGEGDPSQTGWNGVRFRANIPTLVSDPAMIEQAKNNPWFKVEGFPQAERGNGLRLPKTAEEYRFYATQWFSKAPSVRDFASRWKNEQALRDKCGVGLDDEDWLDSIAGPLIAELQKIENAADPQ